MDLPRGIVKIDGIGIADLPRIGLFATDTTARGDRAGVGDEPAAREIGDGVLIIHGHSDLTEMDESFARTYGTRVVAVGLSSSADICTLSVSEAQGRRRHLVDALEESSLNTGDPLPEEEGFDRLTEEAALAIFGRLTGVTRDDIASSEFIILRPAQEQDAITPLIRPS